ncbi:MAG: hypothetical protein COV38_16375 [Bdellovibrionales bacterium CG11_big_fil_rev_8_21_14_0_20_38_13]|nr:MAG: hypothetical protein COW79_09060 [Bdellovibrionales bacterium CG22_combo_CG10-13_8_21_14_all_38_13]PIR28335.1 MAG: hypothetical protein COV38_16375 [Bdellovibrionales bacterium CG11_big_fil_rev_8_21_14_0_20_38_13]
MEEKKEVISKGEGKDVVRGKEFKKEVGSQLKRMVDPDKVIKGTKRGRKADEKKKHSELENKQTFSVSFRKNEKMRQKLLQILREANAKEFGNPVEFDDLVFFLLENITKKDIEKLKENSLDLKAKVMREFAKQNEKKGEEVDFWQYVASSLKIS